MSNDEIAQLRARISELEKQISSCKEEEEIREVELRSLLQEVELKVAYIERLERFREEEVGPKDVHIRNLEAIIAGLSPQHSTDPKGDQASRASARSIFSRRPRGTD